MIIGIDKGHSTWDKSPCGAVGLLNESKENREVGDRVIVKLIGLGHTVIDCSCDSANSINEQLQVIVNKANSQKLDLFCSLHLNAGGGTGAEVYTTKTSGAKEIAKRVLESYVNKTGFKSRGNKYAEYYVLRNTIDPAILLEMCFVDNQKDKERWDSISYDLIVDAIVEGITEEIIVSKPMENKPEVKEECKLLKNCKNNVVSYGATGTYVYMLQSILIALGYNPNGLDGHCGNGMVVAIKSYQSNNGLSVDGSCGPATWTSILTK